MLYPQNGDGIMAVDFVTSLRPVYSIRTLITSVATVTVSLSRGQIETRCLHVDSSGCGRVRC